LLPDPVEGNICRHFISRPGSSKYLQKTLD
jgi:hypothetical protein